MAELTGQPNLTQFAESIVDAASEQIRAAIPGVFNAVASNGKSGDVKPAIARQNASLDPVIPDVPILFPRGGGASITWPVGAGDACLLIVADRDLDAWIRAGGLSTVAADDPRTHDLTDTVAIPVGLDSSSGAGTVKVNIGSGGRVAIGNGTAELVDVLIQTIELFLSGPIGQVAATANTTILPVAADTAVATQAGILKTKLEAIKGTL